MKVYDFENIIEREELLAELESKCSVPGTEFISYYVQGLTNDKISKIKTEIAGCSAIKLKGTQKAVEEGLNTLYETLCDLRSNYGEKISFGVFVRKKEQLIVKLPESLSLNRYHCGKNFEITPLKKYSSIRWALCVLDTQEVTIGILENYDIKVLKNYNVFIPSKIKAGGQSQPRFEETRKNLVYSLIKDVSLLCNDLFERNSVSKFLLGGVIPTSEIFYNTNSLRPDLKEMLEKPTATCYTNRLGLEELLEKNKSEYKTEIQLYYKEKSLFEDVLKERAKKVLLKKNQLIQPYEIEKVFSTNDGRIVLYCEECKCIRKSEECEHKKVRINQKSYITFSSNSKYGKQFKELFGELYQIA